MATVEYDLKEILAKLDSRLDKFEANIEARFDKLEAKIEMAQKDITDLKTSYTSIDSRIQKIEQDVTELKTTQKNQLWTIIGILGTAVLATVFRFVFEGIKV